MSDKRVFIERRSGEGDYAVRKPGSERASAVLPTQAKAIDWTQQRGADVFVERVRETKVGNPGRDRGAAAGRSPARLDHQPEFIAFGFRTQTFGFSTRSCTA